MAERRMTLAVRVTVVAAFAWAVGLAAPASATTFTVNSTADAVDLTPGDGTCATAGGVCTLRAAIQEANALAGADQIQLPAGVFPLTLTGVGENAAATGDLDVTQALEIVGADRSTTIIDGFGADRVFETQASVPFTLRHLTVRNGDPGANAGGGVFHMGPSALTLDDVALVGNRASDGGGVFVNDGPLTVTGCVFDNDVSAGTGGGLFKTGTGVVDVGDSQFTGTRALTADGGGLYLATNMAIGIHATTFTSTLAGAGAAGSGGAVYAATSDTLTVADITVSDAVAQVNGGALYLVSAGGIAISNVAATDVVARTLSGGGLYAATSGSLTATNLTLTNAFGNTGGGAYLAASGSVSIDGAVLRHVTSNGPGGGLYAATGLGQDVTLRNVSVSDGVATGNNPGGGVFATAGRDVIADTVVVEDSEANGPGGGSFLAAGRNLTMLGGRTARCSGVTGGGLYAVAGTALGITGTTVADNTASNSVGGGAYIAGGVSATVDRSTIAGNRATGAGVGGGLLASSPNLVIVNTTISGNAAAVQGGGMLIAGGGTLTNLTIADNVAASGGGIYNGGGTFHVLNTILAGSTTGGNCAGAALTSDGHNIDDGATCAFAGPGDLSNTNPQIGPLADNGGGMLTRSPIAGGPAIDKGAAGGCPAVDQRGTARPTDGDGDGTATCDVGAVEFVDQCPADPAKTLPGICGCGVADTDANGNGVADCLINAELKARIARAKTLVGSLDGTKTPSQQAIQTELAGLADGFIDYVKQFDANIVKTATKPKLAKLAKKARAASRSAAHKHGHSIGKAKTKANKALDAFDAMVAPQ